MNKRKIPKFVELTFWWMRQRINNGYNYEVNFIIHLKLVILLLEKQRERNQKKKENDHVRVGVGESDKKFNIE